MPFNRARNERGPRLMWRVVKRLAAGKAGGSRGFTLVELMVALAIASVLLLALAVMFMNTSIARNELDKSSRQIETGRYAISVLADEIRHAGYYGALANAPSAALGALPDPCANALATVQNSISLPLQGYHGKASADLLDPGNLACLDGAAAGYKPQTGVVVVKRADTSIAAATPTSGYFNIQTSGCAGDPVRYVFDSYANAGNFTLHTNTGAGCLPLATAPAALITPVYIRIFYVSTCSGTDCTGGGDGIPTLKRIDITPAGASTPVALVDGIENIQYEFGIDTSATPDGTPDTYVTSPTFAQTGNIMAVRIYVLARNLDSTSGYSDIKSYVLGPDVTFTPSGTELPYRRHLYSQLVRLNNPSGRLE